jgi:hypothetical protein
MRRRSRSGLAVVLVAVVAVSTACFTSGADFRDDAESYLVDDDGLRAELFPDGDTSIEAATCDEPSSDDVGERFTCTATDTSGGEWEFEVEITGSTAYRVVVVDGFDQSG